MAKIILIATFLLLSCFSFQSKEFLGKNLGLNLKNCLDGLSILPSHLDQALEEGISLETIEKLALVVPELKSLLQDCNPEPEPVLGSNSDSNSDCFSNIAELPNQVNRLVQDLSNGDFEALQADVSSLLVLVQQLEACLSA